MPWIACCTSSMTKVFCASLMSSLLAFVLQFMYDRYMAKSTVSVTQKRRPGRPATGHDPARSVRLSDEIIDRIEKWAMRQQDKPPRSEAIRRLVQRGLVTETTARNLRTDSKS